MKSVIAMTLLVAFAPAAAQVSPALRRMRSSDTRQEGSNNNLQPIRRNKVDAEPGLLGRILEEEEMSMKIVDGSADDGHVHDHNEEPAPEGEGEIIAEYLENSCSMTSPALIASTVGGALFMML